MTVMVDLTNFFSWTFLLHFSRILIMFNIVHTLLKSKYHTTVTFVGIALSGLTYSYFSLRYMNLISNEVVLYSIFIAIELLVVCLTCTGSLFSKLLSVLLGGSFYLLSNVLISPVMMLIGIPSEYFTATKTPLIVVLCFCLGGYTLSFLASFFIKIIQNRSLKKSGKHTTKAFILLLAPVIHLFSFLSFSSFMQLFYENITDTYALTRFHKISIVLSAICFISDFFIFFVVDYIDRLEYKNIENEKQILSNTMTYQQTILLNEEKKEFRKLRHDTNNLLSTAVGFIEIGKSDKALEILKETGVSFSQLGGTSICSNDLLNTIFSIKSKTAEEKNVNMTVHVNENSIVRTDNYDLCRILNNLIDNSLNAAEHSENNKESNITVSINDDCISIITHNTFSNVKKRKIRDIKHGYGITIIKEIIKKYNGTYNTKSDGVTYTTETTIDNI